MMDMAPKFGDTKVTHCDHEWAHRDGQPVLCVWQPCPYAADIDNDDTPMWHCDDCAEQCSGDI